jgi:UDP-glucose-4-epimerase GalE
METVLVVGGAGYIGSHMCKMLAGNGYLPVVLDNLSCGHRAAVKWGPFYHGSMANRSLIDRILTEYQFTAVMSFAAFREIGESVSQPAKYYRNNVTETLCLLDALIEHGVTRFIFSSSCAVYGEPAHLPLDENHPMNPVNPYGRGKQMVEQILADYHRAYGVTTISFRYFNAAGADPEGELGEDHDPETHVIPILLNVALQRRIRFYLYGNDYPTTDGTCVRDYVHVNDLCRAHLAGLQRLSAGYPGGAYNLGTGAGHSVRDLIGAVKRVTGRSIPIQVENRRRGDAAILVAASEKAARDLNWRLEYPDLFEIIETAWHWHQNHPEGFSPWKSSGDFLIS